MWRTLATFEGFFFKFSWAIIKSKIDYTNYDLNLELNERVAL